MGNKLCGGCNDVTPNSSNNEANLNSLDNQKQASKNRISSNFSLGKKKSSSILYKNSSNKNSLNKNNNIALNKENNNNNNFESIYEVHNSDYNYSEATHSYKEEKNLYEFDEEEEPKKIKDLGDSIKNIEKIPSESLVKNINNLSPTAGKIRAHSNNKNNPKNHRRSKSDNSNSNNITHSYNNSGIEYNNRNSIENSSNLEYSKSIPDNQSISREYNQETDKNNYGKYLLDEEIVDTKNTLRAANKKVNNSEEENNNNNNIIIDTIIDKNKSISNLPLIKDKKEIINFHLYTENFGKYERRNGDIYIGEILHKKANGKGILTRKNNYQVKGYFEEDKYTNYIQMNILGSTYEGEAKDNYIEGYGIEKYEDGNCYIGEFKNNNKDGIGIFKWADGAEYQGEMQNNKMQGFGIYKFADGRIYEGEFQNGMFHGIGYLSWNDGKKYIGMFEMDKRTGFGLFLWKKQVKIYIGFFKDGKLNGLGKFIQSHKESYGLFLDSKKIKKYNRNEFFEEIKNSKNQAVITYANFFNIDIEEAISILG